MNRLLGLAGSVWIALLAAATSAHAVDLYPAKDADLHPISWNGFVVAPYFGYETLHLNGAGGDVLKDPKGWRVGGELDYDHQFGNWVLGVAGDAFYTWYQGDGAAGHPELSSRLEDYGTIRGRLGYAVGRWMFFGTGGYAFGNLSVKNSGVDDNKMLSGWTAGGGLEWVWNNNLTIRGELAHISLASETFSELPVGQQDLGATLDLFKIDFVSRF